MREKQGSAIYRPDLGVVVMEYMDTTATGYVGIQVMPIFKSDEKSATFPVIPKEAMLGSGKTARAPRGTYYRDDFEYENGLFNTVEQGREELVDDSERKLIEKRVPGIASFIATKRCLGHIMRSQEMRIAAKLFNTTNFTVHNVSAEWDNASTGKPIGDIAAGVDAFRLQSGFLPDTLLITWDSFSAFKQNDQIVDRLKYTFPGIDINRMNSDQLAAVFNIPRVLIAGALRNSAGKGKDAVMANIWNPEYAMLLKTSDSPDMTEPCVGRTFLWTDDSPENAIVEEYRDEPRRSDVFRVRHHVDEALLRSYDDAGLVVSDIGAACGYLFGNVNTI